MALNTSFRLGCVLAVTLLSTTACYVDDLQDRAPINAEATGPATGPGSARSNFECRTTLSRGCFDGHVLSETGFFVDGKEFFNADDLATRFTELVTIRRDGPESKALVEGKDYELHLDSKLDADNFAHDFTYFLNGESVRRGKVRNDGNFAVSEIGEGLYDLRVQKAIKFLVTEIPAVNPDQPIPNPEDQAPVVKSKQFCATIYADIQLDVRRSRRIFESFDSYSVYVTDNECGEQSTGTTTLSL